MTTKSVDTTVGIITASVGSGGLTMQAMMEGVSLALLVLNLVLAIGGFVLLGYRIKMARRKTRNQRHGDPR